MRYKYACFADKGPLPTGPVGCSKVAHRWDIEDDVRCAKAIYGSSNDAVARLTEQRENDEFIKQYSRYSKTFMGRLARVIDKLEVQ